MKTSDDHYNDIWELLRQIGEAANTPVALYRVVSRKWMELGTRTLIAPAAYLHPAYSYTSYAGSDNFYGPFCIAKPGQNESAGPLVGQVTVFHVQPFPGCCGLAVSSNTTVYDPFRRKGINKLGIKLRQAIAGYAGYTAVLCTDKAFNTGSIRTIEGAGYKKVLTFKNRRTTNEVNLYIKPLE